MLNVHSDPNNIAMATVELAGETSKDDAFQKPMTNKTRPEMATESKPPVYFFKVWLVLWLPEMVMGTKHHRRPQLAEIKISSGGISNDFGQSE